MKKSQSTLFATVALCLVMLPSVLATCSNMNKISLASFTPLSQQKDGRQFPQKTVVNAPLYHDKGKDLDHFGSCAAHCLAYTATKLVGHLAAYDAYISVNEQEKLQYACEGMCRNNLASTKYLISVRVP